MDATLVQTIRQAPLFAALPDDQLDCIRSGEVLDVAPGADLVEPDAPAQFFFLNLAGEIRVSRRYDRQEVLLGVNKPGMYLGEIPLLLDAPWHAQVRVSKPTRLFRLDPAGFWRMLSTCPSVARDIFRTAAHRLRNLEGYSQQREKLASLGTMAAGLAHELNNPAAAARRAAAQLQATVAAVQGLLCQLGKALKPAEWEDLLAAEQEALERLARAAPLDSLTRSDREEALTRWMDQGGIPEGWKLASNFVSADLDAAWLAALTDQLPATSRPAALSWLETRLNLHSLLKLVDQSTGRVADLVKAVKSYTYMDQSPRQEIDVHEGIESTLTMLGHKLKNVTLVRAFDHSVPRILAYGSELNQVWTNLIDNAIDAVDGAGKVCVGTLLEDNQVVVEIVDNGRGIPADIQPRLFEPFFTTKAVGSGTGLGLVISNRIVADRHGGEIEFESRPGETRFRVLGAPGGPPLSALSCPMSETTQFLINHGLPLVFAAVFVEQMGLPLPALPWLMAAGALSATGQFNLFLGLVVTVFACVLADTFWFYLGRYRGNQVLGLLCRISLEPDSCVRRTQNLFTRYGARGLLVSKFVPGLSTVAPPLAGMSAMRIERFLLVDAAGSLLYGGCLLSLGYFLSRQIEQIGAALSRIGGSALGLLAGVTALYVGAKFFQRQRLLRQLRMARISVGELRQRVDAGEELVILDLRSTSAVEQDPALIRGAIHMSVDEINRRHAELPHDRDVILYCSCPNEVTSARVALLLRRKGLTRVRPLLGGIDAWKEQNYPLDPHTPAGAPLPEVAPGARVLASQEPSPTPLPMDAPAPHTKRREQEMA